MRHERAFAEKRKSDFVGMLVLVFPLVSGTQKPEMGYLDPFLQLECKLPFSYKRFCVLGSEQHRQQLLLIPAEFCEFPACSLNVDISFFLYIYIIIIWVSYSGFLPLHLKISSREAVNTADAEMRSMKRARKIRSALSCICFLLIFWPHTVPKYIYTPKYSIFKAGGKLSDICISPHVEAT